jgi:hypothetical protein
MTPNLPLNFSHLVGLAVQYANATGRSVLVMAQSDPREFTAHKLPYFTEEQDATAWEKSNYHTLVRPFRVER